jgi:hypothetical protein
MVMQQAREVLQEEAGVGPRAVGGREVRTTLRQTWVTQMGQAAHQDPSAQTLVTTGERCC